MNDIINVSRRDFLKIGAATGSNLVLGFFLPGNTSSLPSAAPFAPNAFVSINDKGEVTIWVARSEMGQGVRTSMPMILAEELEADWSSIRIEQALADAKYGDMITGGSSSVRGSWERLRKAGATAREMLITAAAQQWGVDQSECRAENGVVFHAGGNKQLPYGKLVDTAAKLPVPDKVTLKNPEDFRFIGKSMPRLDIPQKVDGSAVFGLDMRLPGMLVATVVRCPVFGGKPARFDATKAKAIQGVKHVVEVPTGVAVIAENTWAAIKGRQALEITWNEGSNSVLDGAGIRKMFEERSKETGKIVRKDGDTQAALAAAADKVEAVYECPFLAHATMEPMNCVAHVTKDGAEVWAPTQTPQWTQEAVAGVAGLPKEKVKIHTTLLGGGFGRRLMWDFAVEAAHVAKAAGVPVQVVWTREDDMQHDFYRPASYHRLTGVVDANSRLAAWMHHMVGPSISVQLFGEEEGQEPDAVDGAADLAYAVPNITVDYVTANTAVPIGWWRSVYHSQNAFVNECFLDEMAAAAGKDPYEFRRGLLEKSPRLKGALELAAGKEGWGTPLPAGRYRGIACHACFGSFVAQVAEVSLENNKVRVHRVVCAVDCGRVVNPNTVEAQMESAILYGLTAALKGEITIEKGRVQQGNFDGYQILRINETPVIEVLIVPSSQAPGGIGESGLPPIAPAVANAVSAAAGKRIRKLPIKLSL